MIIYRWAIFNPKGLCLTHTISKYRRDAIIEIMEGIMYIYNVSYGSVYRPIYWKYLYKHGYRCRKIKIETVDWVYDKKNKHVRRPADDYRKRVFV